MTDKKTYTIEEIKTAFTKTFHNSGELYFGGEENDCEVELIDFCDALEGKPSRYSNDKSLSQGA